MAAAAVKSVLDRSGQFAAVISAGAATALNRGDRKDAPPPPTHAQPSQSVDVKTRSTAPRVGTLRVDAAGPEAAVYRGVIDRETLTGIERVRTAGIAASENVNSGTADTVRALSDAAESGVSVHAGAVGVGAVSVQLTPSSSMSVDHKQQRSGSGGADGAIQIGAAGPNASYHDHSTHSHSHHHYFSAGSGGSGGSVVVAAEPYDFTSIIESNYLI